MKLSQRITQSLESVFLAMFMVWTLGISVALLTSPTKHERQGVVEIHALTPVHSNIGA